MMPDSPLKMNLKKLDLRITSQLAMYHNITLRGHDVFQDYFKYQVIKKTLITAFGFHKYMTGV